MHIQKLPTYSCERYYLLSEIEQRAEFVFIDEPDCKAKGRQSTQNPRIDSIYLLWNSSSDVEGLKGNIKKLLELYPSCQSRCVIVVECLVTSELEFDSTVKSKIDELFTWAGKSYPDVFIFVGVSDKPSGTPGLEKLEGFMKDAVASAPGVSGNLRLIGMTRQDCLGHDPNREPDADSDVFQVLCCRSVEACEHWQGQFRDYIQQLYGVLDGNPSAALTGPEASGFKACGVMTLVVALAVVAVIVGVAVQVFLADPQLEPSP